MTFKKDDKVYFIYHQKLQIFTVLDAMDDILDLDIPDYGRWGVHANCCVLAFRDGKTLELDTPTFRVG